MAVPFAVSTLVAGICTGMLIVVIPIEFETHSFSCIHCRNVEISCGEERKTCSRVRGIYIISHAWLFLVMLLFVQDEGQGASHGSPALPPDPLPGSAIRHRSRHSPAELRQQETDEYDAETTPEQIPLIPMPPSAQREESGASAVCESPRRSAAGSPSVERSSPGREVPSPSREVPSPGREVPDIKVEPSLLLASIDYPRYIHYHICNYAVWVGG